MMILPLFPFPSIIPNEKQQMDKELLEEASQGDVEGLMKANHRG